MFSVLESMLETIVLLNIFCDFDIKLKRTVFIQNINVVLQYTQLFKSSFHKVHTFFSFF